MIKVTLKDGVVKEYESGTTVAEVAKSLGAGLYKSMCACKINGNVCDVRTPLTEDCELAILTKLKPYKFIERYSDALVIIRSYNKFWLCLSIFCQAFDNLFSIRPEIFCKNIHSDFLAFYWFSKIFEK